MQILLLGNGGREHAFAWKIGQSPSCSQLFIAPGNAGTHTCGTNVDLAISDFEGISQFVLEQQIQMLIIGPEQPLVDGIYDYFALHHPHVQVIGPSEAAARLEGSKAYAKEFMQAYDIPTASYRSFQADELLEARAYIEQLPPPIVLKADGLAAGKGVIIAQSTEEALSEIDAMLSGKFGRASQTVVIESFLDGIEFSVFVLTDGEHYKLLPVAKDYKRIGEGDTGLNTGGMGSVSPPPFVDDTLMQKVKERIIDPTMKGLKDRALTYYGFLYFGLINVDGEPYVIEYNCRMGDPETQPVMLRIESDLVELMQLLGSADYAKVDLKINPETAAAIVAVSKGYPGAYEKGKQVHGLSTDNVANTYVFHAGTRTDSGKVLTSGGRVLAVAATGANLQEALQKAYQRLDSIQFEGKNFRADIGFDLM